jgi:hypothetical protein
MEPPQFPVGPFVPEENYNDFRKAQLIAIIEECPSLLRRILSGLSDAELDTRYKNWTVRQIVHHLADSHVNAYIRFKLALTEEVPTIKPYNETLWADLEDSRTGDVAVPLTLLEGLHQRWVQLLRSMTPKQFSRCYFHPEPNREVSLSFALASYAWHCKHHPGQITWLRENKGWARLAS